MTPGMEPQSAICLTKLAANENFQLLSAHSRGHLKLAPALGREKPKASADLGGGKGEEAAQTLVSPGCDSHLEFCLTKRVLNAHLAQPQSRVHTFSTFYKDSNSWRMLFTFSLLHWHHLGDPIQNNPGPLSTPSHHSTPHPRPPPPNYQDDHHLPGGA